MNCETQLISIHIGEEAVAIKAARLLFDKGVLAPAIIWPTVQQGKARIRVTVMATHTAEQIDRALEALREMGKEIGVI